MRRPVPRTIQRCTCQALTTNHRGGRRALPPAIHTPLPRATSPSARPLHPEALCVDRGFVAVVSVPLRTIGLRGVPTSSAGKVDGVARGPAVLRDVGLVDALHRSVTVLDYGDVALPAPAPTRASLSHVLDPGGLDA